jgi:small-conductance mechanosensitive channel
MSLYKNWWAGLLIFLVLTGGLLAQQSNESPSEQQEIESPSAIPISEVSDRAIQQSLKLKQLRTKLDTIPDIRDIAKKLPVFLDSLNSFKSDSIYNKLDKVSSRRLQALKEEWRLYLQKLNRGNKILLKRSQEFEVDERELTDIKTVWQKTNEESKSTGAPEAIQQRINSILEEIGNVDGLLKKRMNGLLTLQDKISEEGLEITQLISRIETAEVSLRSRLFVRDSPPLWQIFSQATKTEASGKQFIETWKDFFRANMAFVAANEDRFYIHIFILVILLILMNYLSWKNRKHQLFTEDDVALRPVAFFISHPFSVAFLITVFLSVWLYPDRPEVVTELVFLLILIPVFILVPGIFKPETRKLVYFFLSLYVLDLMQAIFSSYLLLSRSILLIFILLAIVITFWSIKPKSPIYQLKHRTGIKYFLRLGPVILLVLIVSLLANIVGSVSLSHELAIGVVGSINVGIVVFVIARVLDGIVTLFIRNRRKKVSQIVDTYAQSIERRIIFLIHLVLVLIWLRASLKLFGLFQPLKNWFGGILENTWVIGTVEVSVNGIFDFILILIATFFLTRLIRIILEMEIFPRIRLPRGIPGAISMVVRYTLIALGIILALSAVGINLGKFGLLAGALGVGIGFGLQNIIANFVSGLILAFERPIQTGDVVEIGNVTGSVQSIGVRSSTVKTFDGSEVIVPNADLISNKVTNWTLSDYRRRINLPVKVAFGNDPHKVIEILLKIANEHPGVLGDPKPIATFNGFGDNFLDFTLYYWIKENILQYKSEVALGIHDAIKQAGIGTPRPQRDLNLTTFDSAKLKQIVNKLDSTKRGKSK